MNSRLYLLVSVLAVCLSPLPASAEGVASCIERRNRSALLFIEVEYKDVNGQMQTGAGSGFIISRQGHVITGSHLVPAAGNSGLKLMARVASRFTFPVLLDVVDRSSVAGLALLKLPHPGTDYVPVALGRSKGMLAGSDVFAMGFPRASESSVASGFLRSTSVRSGGEAPSTWPTSLVLDAGHGGGPVFDARGVVVAVAAARPNEGDAIPIDAAAPLLNLAGVTRQRAALADPAAC